MCDHGFLVHDPDDQGNVYLCKMCQGRFEEDPTMPPLIEFKIPSTGNLTISKAEMEEMVRQINKPLMVTNQQDYVKTGDMVYINPRYA